MSRVGHRKIMDELGERFRRLDAMLACRDLAQVNEGAGGRKYWHHPEKMCATLGSSFDIAMAVEDFKNILVEIKKLK